MAKRQGKGRKKKKKDPHGMHSGIGRFHFGHFNRSDTQGPNVRFAIISDFFDNLWSHPVGSSSFIGKIKRKELE